MNRLACFLSGGHEYDPESVIVCDCCFLRRFVIFRFCKKCGKRDVVNIGNKSVLGQWIEDGMYKH